MLGLVRGCHGRLFHRIHITRLHSRSGSRLDLGLPSRSSKVFDAVRILEHSLSLLKGLSSCLREEEEHVDKGSEIEDAKDNVGLPLDAGKGGWDKNAQRGVERPVS